MANSPRSHLQRVRNQADAGNMGKLADEALKAAVSSDGHWGDGWAEILDLLRGLPLEERRRLAHALVDRFHSLTEESAARPNVLTLLGIIGRDLPDDFFLPTERLAELVTLGGRHSFWYASRFDVLAEAELATGRPLPPSVVAVFRRAAMVAYRSDALADLVKKLPDPGPQRRRGVGRARHGKDRRTGRPLARPPLPRHHSHRVQAQRQVGQAGPRPHRQPRRGPHHGTRCCPGSPSSAAPGLSRWSVRRTSRTSTAPTTPTTPTPCAAWPGCSPSSRPTPTRPGRSACSSRRR